MRQRHETDTPPGHVLIFAGPHGAGKDTHESHFTNSQPNASRIVRHITRDPHASEVNGEDYHFVSEAEFLDMIARGDFMEYAKYIGAMSGTSRAELETKIGQAEFASLTANFEDGLGLHRQLRVLGISSLCFFISPVSQETIREDPAQYLAALRRRLVSRGRPSDLIEGRLLKAESYRKLYLANAEAVTYIDNRDGYRTQAAHTIARAAIAHAMNAVREEPVQRDS